MLAVNVDVVEITLVSGGMNGSVIKLWKKCFLFSLIIFKMMIKMLYSFNLIILTKLHLYFNSLNVNLLTKKNNFVGCLAKSGGLLRVLETLNKKLLRLSMCKLYKIFIYLLYICVNFLV